MKISDKTIGTIAIILTSTTLSWLAATMWFQDKHSVSHFLVQFDDVGSLQPQDPVAQRGVVIGRVGTITYNNRQAEVTIEFDQPLIFREGTQFINENYSLMGERMITIKPSPTGKLLSESSVIKGDFQPGIAETMKQMVFVVQSLSSINKTVQLLAHGDSKHKSLIDQIHKLTLDAEYILQMSDEATLAIAPRITDALHQTSQLSKTSIQLMNSTQKMLDTLYTVSNTQLSQAQTEFTTINTYISQLDTNINQLEKSPIYHELLQKRKALDNLIRFEKALHQLIRWIRISAGSLNPDPNRGERKTRIIHGKNVNVFGPNARDKAQPKDQAPFTEK